MARLGCVTVLALDTARLRMLVTRRAPLALVEQGGLRGSPGARALAAPEAVLECWAFFALIGELLAVAAVLARRVASIATEGAGPGGVPCRLLLRSRSIPGASQGAHGDRSVHGILAKPTSMGHAPHAPAASRGHASQPLVTTTHKLESIGFKPFWRNPLRGSGSEPWRWSRLVAG